MSYVPRSKFTAHERIFVYVIHLYVPRSKFTAHERIFSVKLDFEFHSS